MKKIQLSIPEPCHESWQQMTPTQQGRYCNACTKEVIDFSDMSDTEVLNYFLKRKDDTVCGRVQPDQLDRFISALPAKKKYWQWRYVLSAALFFLKPAKSPAQGLVSPIAYDSTFDKPGDQYKKEGFIRGNIKDEKGEAVAFASIMVEGTSFGTNADEEGRFIIKREGGMKSLKVSALGYEMKSVQLNGEEENTIVLKKVEKLLDEVVLKNDYSVRRMGGLRMSCYSWRSVFRDTVKSWITMPMVRIYPSPVAKGATFTVKLHLKQTGIYAIQISDAAGRLIQEKKVKAASKEWNEQLSSSNWSSDVYYVKVTDDKGKQVNTGNFVIQ